MMKGAAKSPRVAAAPAIADRVLFLPLPKSPPTSLVHVLGEWRRDERQKPAG
jgi:hypothetical protein